MMVSEMKATYEARIAALEADLAVMLADRDCWRRRCIANARKEPAPPKPLKTAEMQALVQREVYKQTRYLRLRAEKAEEKARLYADALLKATGGGDVRAEDR